ncbi:CPBP family intramembrane metalloprotease [Filobacillus milosensis]|uniref:CPBP family intramembrane metalloprotease n=1 Tax=Filobacillus milosensis TaxID=94137 RepID=A0A4Y8ICS6_9BACI|nr:type II CAAX endopeptidase family protein [Filobacillus milosensis]TFB13689.1 CPBP family intramembrane metalloprotease [Filobacillus milosensis]
MVKRYWIIIILYIAAQLFPAIGAGLAISMLGVSEGDAFVYSYIFGMTIASIITIALLSPDMEQSQMRNRPGIPYIIKWAVIGFFLAFLAQYVANIINITILDLDQSSENTKLIMDIIDENVYFILLPILFAPLLEEIIFRKIIFGQLYKKMNFFFSAVISALIFSLLHFDFTFVLTYLAMGLVFAYLYVKTQRIIVPILVHMAMNTTVVLIQMNVDIDELERKLEEIENSAMILIGG